MQSKKQTNKKKKTKKKKTQAVANLDQNLKH